MVELAIRLRMKRSRDLVRNLLDWLFASFFGFHALIYFWDRADFASLFSRRHTAMLPPPTPPYNPFNGNFQSCQRDTEWKVSYEFQRPDKNTLPASAEQRSSPRTSAFRINHRGRCFLLGRKVGGRRGAGRTGSAMFPHRADSAGKSRRAETEGGMNPLGVCVF